MSDRQLFVIQSNSDRTPSLQMRSPLFLYIHHQFLELVPLLKITCCKFSVYLKRKASSLSSKKKEAQAIRCVALGWKKEWLVISGQWLVVSGTTTDN